jgi:MOSC domain-containing protein YiiM
VSAQTATATGRVLSIQVGLPSDLDWRGKKVPSGIVKHRVDGRHALGFDGFPGDEQADLTVHGGPDKAVCCYPSEHLAGWAASLQRPELTNGAFGENLTLAGLTEDTVCIGDTYTLGTATVQVSQPRGPCFKLAARWGARTLPAEMARGLKSGFYFRVLEPGDVGAGDRLELVQRVSDITVAEVMRVTYRDRHDPPALRAVVAVPELAEQWQRALDTLVRHNLLPLRDPVGDD